MDITEIHKVLPHRPPMLLVDRILAMEPGVYSVGMKAVTVNEDFFRGHFPGHPIMPAVLITEFMAQVGGCLLLSVSGNESKLAYFAGIDRQKFRKPVGPGDILVARVELISAKGRIGKVRATAWVFRLETSNLGAPIQDANLSSLARNSVSLIEGSGETESQRERSRMVLGMMEGELAAEGELMFALVDREEPAPNPA
jgi:3-hydroxyacyl-[acyl-carrier-protein] dehydratase